LKIMVRIDEEKPLLALPQHACFVILEGK